MVTRVNSATIGNSGTTASAYTTTLGVAASVGDLIVVTMNCNGTHATNGMAFSDSVNGTYTVLKEQDLSASSTRWEQTFYKVATGAMTSAAVLTATPYAANTSSTFVADVFTGLSGTISEAVVGSSPAAGLTFAAPPLGANAPTGDLALSLVSSAAGTLSVAAPFTLGSARTTGPSCANGYVLSASGSSTYGVTWTISASNSNAAETVSFAAGGAAAPPPKPIYVRRVAVCRAAVI